MLAIIYAKLADCMPRFEEFQIRECSREPWTEDNFTYCSGDFEWFEGAVSFVKQARGMP